MMGRGEGGGPGTWRRALAALAAALLGAPAMAAPRRACDLLIRGGTVVTVDAADHVFSPGAVAVSGGKIVAVGPESLIAGRYSGRRLVWARGRIVMPGLVNGHQHAAMTLFRGLGADMSLHDWLTKKIFPAEARNVSRQFVRDGTRLACLEMIEGGTTTFADMYYFESDAAEVVRRAGMRGVMGETFIDFPVPDHKNLAETLSYTRAFIERWKGDPLITPAVAPHAPYTCSRKTLLAARDLAERYGVPVEIHVSETKKEVEDAVSKWGKDPVEYLDSIGFFRGVRVIAAHVVWPQDQDFDVLRRAGVAVVHNPESNMKLASGIAPMAEYARRGVAWCLGTDGAASNDDLSMFESMDYAAKLAKVGTGDPTALPAESVVRAATIGGARALGLGVRIGSLEPGKDADIILVDTTSPHATPGDDPYAMLVYSLKASDVTDAWVAGRRLLRDRRPTTLDARTILSAARRWRRRIEATLR